MAAASTATPTSPARRRGTWCTCAGRTEDSSWRTSNGANHRLHRRHPPDSDIAWTSMAQRFYVETLGCPKNQVDSDKLVGTLLADGLQPTDDPTAADLVVVNTCAFIEDARRESIDTILALEDRRKDGAKLVVTGCMAERYGHELAE